MAALAAAGIDVASAEEDRERRADNLQMAPTSSGEWQGGSSWQSLARGAGSIEAEFLNGEIALLGRLYGVPTPVNALLERLALRAAAEGQPPGQLDHRGVEHGSRGRTCRVNAAPRWPTTSPRPTPRPSRSPAAAARTNGEAAVPGEDWPVGVVLHHIAEGHGQASRWLQAMSSGEGVPETAEDIDRANAAHAVRAESVTRARPSRCSRFAVPSSRGCCAGSTTSNWTGRRRSARPGGRSSPVPIWRR